MLVLMAFYNALLSVYSCSVAVNPFKLIIYKFIIDKILILLIYFITKFMKQKFKNPFKGRYK